ncbi:MAG: hypothetical protein QNJ53_11985 [Pleurocapsa sp. MO_192.B19]|nr:hypothetical protein [Pleurocapsa sp. MO_192.B19]
MFDDALKQAKKASTKTKEQKVEKVEEAKPKKRKSSGKRTDPDFKQVGAYIRKETYLQIQRLLLEQPDKDFSDLVEELLTDYLNNQLTD